VITPASIARVHFRTDSLPNKTVRKTYKWETNRLVEKAVNLDSQREITVVLSDMGMGFSTGSIELTMRGSGVIIRLRGRAHSGMLREMSIGESSKMIWRMAMESIFIVMEVSIRESLRMMSRRGMGRKSGLMAPSMWASILMA